MSAKRRSRVLIIDDSAFVRKAVARMLGIDVSAVYIAKSRVLGGARKEFEKLRARDEEF